MPTPYDNETFMQSLLASEGDVQKKVGDTLAEVERRRQLAHTKLGEARTEQNRVFDWTGADHGRSMGQMRGNLDRFGGLFKGLQAYDTTGFDRAMGTMRGGYGEAMGLMGQGFDEQSTQRIGAANSIRDALLADITRQRTDYISRREGEDRAAEEARKAAELQRQHEIDLANIQAASYGGGGGGWDLSSLFADGGTGMDGDASTVEGVGKVASAPKAKNTAPAGPVLNPNVITDPQQIADLLATGPDRDTLAWSIGVAPQQLMQLEDGSWMIQTPNGLQPIGPRGNPQYGQGLGVLRRPSGSGAVRNVGRRLF